MPVSTLLLAAALGACGPVEYVNQVTRRARYEVGAAKAAVAERYAPYEYTMAVEYLRKAREEAGASDYQAAIRFGKVAEQMARKATETALAKASADPNAKQEDKKGEEEASAGDGGSEGASSSGEDDSSEDE
ncbi:MAG: DUF4398 domain-containing protein [Pseudomonadota bacterium]